MHRVEANRVEVLKPSAYDAGMTKLEDYVTVSEFSKLVGISVQAVHKAMRTGRISRHQRVGSIYLIDRNEVTRFRAVDKRKGEDVHD